MHALKHTLRSKGFTIPVAILITTALSIIVAGILSYAIASKRLNSASRLWIEAKNASESVVEYALADLTRKFSTKASLSVADMTVTVPESHKDFFKGKYNNVDPDTIAVKVASPKSWPARFLDPNDPANQGDPMAGKIVRVMEVDVFGKATAKITGGITGSRTSYTMERLQVRDSALFTHAVFYNMDLEFHPGAAQSVDGPVHSNGNIFLYANPSLDFLSTMTTPKKIYLSYPTNVQYDTKGNITGRDGSTNGVVRIKNLNSGTALAFETGKDAFLSSWENYAANRWGNAVLTDVHGVQPIKSVNIADFVQPKPWVTTPGPIAKMNHAYALIEPQLGTNANTTYDKDSKGAEVENQKISAQAGLIVRIKETVVSGANTPDKVQLLYYEPSSGIDTAVSYTNPPKRDPSTGLPAEKVIMEYSVTDLAAILAKAPAARTAEERLKAAIQIEKFAYSNPSSKDSAPLAGGFWDAREGHEDGNRGEKHLVRLDIAALREFIDDNNATYTPAAWPGGYEPAKHYNGVIYVEAPLAIPRGSTAHTSRPDKIRTPVNYSASSAPNMRGYGLWIQNAQNLPDPKYNQSSSTRDRGFTVGTNMPTYIHGHYNSDGNVNTGSGTTPDTKAASNAEVPAAIIADAVTIISLNTTSTTSSRVDQGGVNSATMRSAAPTEVSTAIVTGAMASIFDNKDKYGNKTASGGVMNLPRFLEDWKRSTVFQYRGSLVCLFESESSTAQWNVGYNKSWYLEPVRRWGMHQFFKDGTFPPATPFVRSYRRVNFVDVTQKQYDDMKL